MIKRKILSHIEDHLSSDQMTIITGPRQVGKTYLMQVLKDRLEKKGKKTLWLNLELEDDAEKFTSQLGLVSYIKLQLGKEKGYVFIDEIQKKENAGTFLKGIFDMNLPYKFIISGSGSLELKAKISESMAGRKLIFTLNPVSFEEFVNYKTGYKYESKLDDFYEIEDNKTIQLFNEYMTFGGYPRVVLADSVMEKNKQMQEIYRSYIDKDIGNLLRLEKSEAFGDLIKVLASQIGGLVNFTELSSTLGIDEKTVKHYLWYLQETYIIKKVTPFYRNVRKEITKSPVYYFLDTGLRNWMLKLFGLPDIPTPLKGHLFENVVFNTLRDKLMYSPSEIHFWRTRDSAEVDFVKVTGLDVVPIEAKHSNMKKSEVSRSYRNFLSQYKPKVGYVVNLKHEDKVKIGQTEVIFVPFYKLYKISDVLY